MKTSISLLKKIFPVFFPALLSLTPSCGPAGDDAGEAPGVAVLLVDTDRPTGNIDVNLYGHFLEHINHSVVDGLFAEQIRGQGFEGDDFTEYWEPFAEDGEVSVEDIPFENGEKSIRLEARGGRAGIRQNRVFIEKDAVYDGYLWVSLLEGKPDLSLVVRQNGGELLAEISLQLKGDGWQRLDYAFTGAATDTSAVVELTVSGEGVVLADFWSLMRKDYRENGMMRPDLVEALQGLKPPFLRWPGGSYASVYRWQDGIGPHVSRKYHPNEIWGGYSDYYGFGTEEFMELCRVLDTDPMVVLPATGTEPEKVEYAMNWVHYLLDPPATEWGALRAANGHPEPYAVPYIQIDNEPMNHGLSPEQYAEIVNVYGSRLREIAPNAKIVACGQKRSNDLSWSRKVIDLAGEHFDILGCHNYEYESENFQTGLKRIRDYLIQLRDYVRQSDHPDIEVTVLEWNLSRTYDWRAGLHAAGSLILYESLGPELTMSCPALLMRNTTDDPTWSAFIYHDHVSWFPGSGYLAQKLFRDHYAPRYLSYTSGTFSDIERRRVFLDHISTMKPEGWVPGTVDAIATAGDDGRRVVIKAVNYENRKNLLLTRLEGSSLPEEAAVSVYRLQAGLHEAASLQEPDRIAVEEETMDWSRDLSFELPPYSVMVAEITW
ncbi:MAG TPA: alpha-N-arabinofuranosidase [Bacteroidetes bacterium]|nr:alpha-N-arabinofuranosidase [Bacteroidota bacterium]